MPVGTAVHDRTSKLCESLSYRDWSGYYAVSVYETHHEHEYNAVRNASALFDITPLYKYVIRGKHACRLLDRVVTRNMEKVAVGRVIYTPWCDEEGKTIDDGTITRLDETTYRLTAADPTLRWLRQNAIGMDVEVEDVSERLAALALQGPTSGRLMKKVADADIENLRYFRMTRGTIAGVPVEISRNGYTGDLGFELWIPWNDAGKVWDALMEEGRAFGIHAAGMLALDIARIEAGLILIEVDFTSSRKALIESQKYSPYEIGLGKTVHLDKGNFVGRAALEAEQRRGPSRRLVGLSIDWPEVEAHFEKVGLAPQVPSTASRCAVPVYAGRQQAGKATSTTWSPTLKRMIALANLTSEHALVGSRVQMEITVEAVRHRAGATIVDLPFYDPPQKTATPIV
ncbi:MAG: aminomethyltransferase family protein [Acidobacteriota bacterium]